MVSWECLCCPLQLPPGARDWVWNSEGLSHNCQWLEVALFLRHFCLRSGVLPLLTMTAEAEGFLSIACVWFWRWTQGGRAKQWQSLSWGGRALEATASQNAQITGGSAADYLSLSNIPSCSSREIFSNGSFYPIVFWKLIWVFFESVFLEKHW